MGPTKRKFGKWLMSKGLKKDQADAVCTVVKMAKGQISYRDIYQIHAFKPKLVFFDVLSTIFERVDIS